MLFYPIIDKDKIMQVYLPVAEISLDVIPILFLGLMVGVASGMFGVGGGFIITPVLIFLNIPPQVAVAAGVSQIAGTSISGALSSWYNNRVDITLTKQLFYGSLVGLTFGAVWLFFLYQGGNLNVFINVAYVLFLLTMSGLMLLEEIKSATKDIFQGPKKTTTEAHGQQHALGGANNRRLGLVLLARTIYLEKSQVSVNHALVLCIGAMMGAMSVLLGIGGSIVLIPMLIYLCQIPLHIAIGTSFVMTFLTASISALLHASITHSLDIVLAFLLCLGSIIGIRFGMYLFDCIQTKYTRLLFLMLLIFITIRMFINLWQPPHMLYLFQVFI